jgi:hypothetical protein
MSVPTSLKKRLSAIEEKLDKKQNVKKSVKEMSTEELYNIIDADLPAGSKSARDMSMEELSAIVNGEVV